MYWHTGNFVITVHVIGFSLGLKLLQLCKLVKIKCKCCLLVLGMKSWAVQFTTVFFTKSALSSLCNLANGLRETQQTVMSLEQSIINKGINIKMYSEYIKNIPSDENVFGQPSANRSNLGIHFQRGIKSIHNCPIGSKRSIKICKRSTCGFKLWQCLQSLPSRVWGMSDQCFFLCYKYKNKTCVYSSHGSDGVFQSDHSARLLNCIYFCFH